MVSALASRIRDREFESRDQHFPQNQIIIIFYFLVFPFNFSPFLSKTMCEYILKVRQHQGKTRHIAWLSSFLFKVQCFYRDENDVHCTRWQILHVYKRRKELFVVLATFWKNDNSSCFRYTNSFNWKSSFVLIYHKSGDGYPNFLFSYLLLIALYTNSTYIIWLKKIFCSILFSKFLTRDYFFIFVPSSSIADSGTVWLDTYIKIIVICRDIHRTLRKL